jgi:hypothetical protein
VRISRPAIRELLSTTFHATISTRARQYASRSCSPRSRGPVQIAAYAGRRNLDRCAADRPTLNGRPLRLSAMSRRAQPSAVLSLERNLHVVRARVDSRLSARLARQKTAAGSELARSRLTRASSRRLSRICRASTHLSRRVVRRWTARMPVPRPAG